jgi:predicted O-methyltransferase YrrM
MLERVDAVTDGVPWTSPGACHLLFDLAASFPQPQILEVSCGYGKATAYLAAAARVGGGLVRCVDIERPQWQGRTVEQLLAAVDALDSCQVTLACDARWYLLDLLSRLPDEWIHLAYIDASHTVEIDAFVALAAWTHLRPGGILVFDDLDWIPGRHGLSGSVYSRPASSHVRALYDYVRGLPGVDEAREWDRDSVEWPLGLVRKLGPGAKAGCGVSELLAGLLSANTGVPP